MKIVHYLPRIRLEEGGVVRAVIDLVTELAAAGQSVTLLTNDPADAPPEWERMETLDVVTVAAGGRGVSDESAQQALASATALHLHTPWEVANIAFARAARRRNLPYILSVHGMLDDWSMSQRRLKKRIFLALLGRSLIGNATFVHCTAEGELAQVSRWLYGAEGVVAPLVIDLAPFRQLPGPALARAEFKMDPEGNEILFLSRIHVKKGIERLLAAMQTLRDRGIECRAIIAGTGEPAYVESLQRLAERCGVADAVQFPGHVGGDLKISLYEAADVFALPTSQENFGLVLPEALACRTPVVTTKAVDIWPELERSGGAVIIENDSESLADALEQLLADKGRLKEMGNAARDWVLHTYSAETVLNQYIEIYRKAAQSALSTSS